MKIKELISLLPFSQSMFLSSWACFFGQSQWDKFLKWQTKMGKAGEGLSPVTWNSFCSKKDNPVFTIHIRMACTHCHRSSFHKYPSCLLTLLPPLFVLRSQHCAKLWFESDPRNSFASVSQVDVIPATTGDPYQQTFFCDGTHHQSWHCFSGFFQVLKEILAALYMSTGTCLTTNKNCCIWGCGSVNIRPASFLFCQRETEKQFSSKLDFIDYAWIVKNKDIQKQSTDRWNKADTNKIKANRVAG